MPEANSRAQFNVFIEDGRQIRSNRFGTKVWTVACRPSRPIPCLPCAAVETLRRRRYTSKADHRRRGRNLSGDRQSHPAATWTLTRGGRSYRKCGGFPDGMSLGRPFGSLHHSPRTRRVAVNHSREQFLWSCIDSASYSPAFPSSRSGVAKISWVKRVPFAGLSKFELFDFIFGAIVFVDWG